MKAQPKCFANPKFVLGNPWRDEPYGYQCSDGRRSFLALNNCTWKDVVLPLPRTPGDSIYRWYPDPVRLAGNARKIALRPFEVVLLELVPAGEKPSLSRRFSSKPIPLSFAESSRAFPVTTRPHAKALKLPVEEPVPPGAPAPELFPKRTLQARGRAPASKQGGLLVITAKLHKGTMSFPINRFGGYTAANAKLNGRAIPCVAVGNRKTYPVSWQAWRIQVPPSSQARDWTLLATVMLPKEVQISWNSHFIPTT